MVSVELVRDHVPNEKPALSSRKEIIVQQQLSSLVPLQLSQFWSSAVHGVRGLRGLKDLDLISRADLFNSDHIMFK